MPLRQSKAETAPATVSGEHRSDMGHWSLTPGRLEQMCRPASQETCLELSQTTVAGSLCRSQTSLTLSVRSFPTHLCWWWGHLCWVFTWGSRKSRSKKSD